MADRSERLEAANVAILGEAKDGRRKFDMLAYTGCDVGRAWGRMVVDMAGISRHEKMAMLLEHDDASPVAVCTDHEVTKEGLRLKGYFLSTPEAQKVCKLADEGLPWKASIGIRFGTTEELAEGAESEVNGITHKGPMTIVRKAHLFETSFIVCNPADLATSAEVMHSEAGMDLKDKKDPAADEKLRADLEKAAQKGAQEKLTERRKALMKAFPKRPKFAARCFLEGKNVVEAKAQLADVLLAKEKARKLKAKEDKKALAVLKSENRHRGIGFAKSETGTHELTHLPVEERARIEVGSNNRLKALFRDLPNGQKGEALYAAALKYEQATRQDGSKLFNDRVLELAAAELAREADPRFGPIGLLGANGERLNSYGKSGPDYSLIAVKGFLGSFYWAFEQELAGIWAPRVGLRVESNQETETHRWLGLFPQLSEWLGGIREDGMPIYSFAITNKLYRASIGIDKNDFKNQKFGLINMRMGEAGAIAAEHWNALVSTLLETNGTCYDGVNFFATTHAMGGLAPATQSNDIDKTTYAALAVGDVNNVSVAEMANAILFAVPHVRTFVGNNNQPLNGGARKFMIMVPQALEGVAFAAVRSDRLNFGQTNPLGVQELSYDVVVNPRLTKKGVFYVLREDCNNKSFILQEPGPPETLFQGPGSYLEWVSHKFGFGIETTRAAGYGAWESTLRVTLG